jgi:N-acetylglutamate synthase-like GNAT family acetyltransferase
MSEKGEVNYRRASAADRDDVLAVLETANFHHIPSPEMPELDLSRFFVAEVDGDIVGVAGWKVLGADEGKTTLMAVDPAYRGWGIGMELQRLRMREMSAAGCRWVITNADRPETIRWYQRHFGYEVVGSLPKDHEFGAPDVADWTTLRTDIHAWLQRARSAPPP